MRIYAVADIHGKPAKIERIRKVLSESKPDTLVVAGDITNYLNADSVVEQLNSMPVPVLAIRGNTDLPKVDRLLEQYPNTSSLHLKDQTISGVKFTGIGGTIPVPFNSRISWRERGIFERLATLVNDDSVLVVHCPPRGVLDEVLGRFHAGCHRLYQLISHRQPRLAICGHIHERPGLAYVGRTPVVNCCLSRTGRGAIINLASDGSVTVDMLKSMSI